MTMFETIENKRDYKFALHYIELLKAYERPDCGGADHDSDEIIRVKRAIREYTHRKPGNPVFCTTFDGYIEKIVMPYDNLEDNEEYFEECIYIEPYRTCYDCTGRPFTAWHTIVKQGGRFVCYHSIGYDY